MSLVEKILKRFGYSKAEFPVEDLDVDLADLETDDGFWGLEGLGGISKSRKPERRDDAQ